MPLLKSVKIDNILTSNNVFLAPMAGITDISYRLIAKRFGVGLLFTEMVSSYAIIYRNRETDRICKIAKEERPVGIQLFGSKAGIMEEAAKILEEKYRPDIIDINAGCPVRKVLKSGAGAKLLESPEKLFDILKRIVNVIDIPVTVKMRLGINKGRINILENSLAAQEAGVKMVTLHPRTADEGFGGMSRWEYIAAVKERLSIPVCGNGDIKNSYDAVRMIEETNCDAIMVGRGAIGNPWLIKQIVSAFSVYPEDFIPDDVSFADRFSVALDHLKLACEVKGEHRGIMELRRILPHYIKGIKNSAKIRNSIVRANSYSEIENLLISIIDEKVQKV